MAHSKPVVDAFFDWCERQLQRSDLTPSSPLTKALGYVLRRAHALRVFLENPDVPLDTNHLERALRPIPMGRNYAQPRIMHGSPMLGCAAAYLLVFLALSVIFNPA